MTLRGSQETRKLTLYQKDQQIQCLPLNIVEPSIPALIVAGIQLNEDLQDTMWVRAKYLIYHLRYINFDKRINRFLGVKIFICYHLLTYHHPAEANTTSPIPKVWRCSKIPLWNLILGLILVQIIYKR
jgi:hypothetical protein